MSTPVGDWIRKRWPDNPGATHYLGEGDDPGCCAGPHARCTYEAGWREGLTSLAAVFDRLTAVTSTEADAHAANGDEDVECVAAGASDAWRAAAQRARGRARSARSAGNEGAPVSREGQDAAEPLSANEIPAGVVAAARRADLAGRPAEWSWVAPPDDQVRRLIAGAVAAERDKLQPAIDRIQHLAAAAQAKAVEHAVAAERERIYAQLGNEHFVTFIHGRWAIEHSAECRLSGRMSECAYHQAVAAVADDFLADRGGGTLGRWRITSISDGLPDLERADD